MAHALSDDWEASDTMFLQQQMARPSAPAALRRPGRLPAPVAPLRLNATLEALWREAASRHQQHAQSVAAASSLPSAGQSPVAAAWAAHHDAWGPPSVAPLDVKRIPWPPCVEGLLHEMARHEGQRLQQPEGREAAFLGQELSRQREHLLMKRALRTACLRWHPDKMSARLADCPDATARQAALRRTAAILLAVQEQWRAWLRDQGHDD